MNPRRRRMARQRRKDQRAFDSAFYEHTIRDRKQLARARDRNGRRFPDDFVVTMRSLRADFRWDRGAR